MTYDLLIKGGKVIDRLQGLNAVRDIALNDGKVAAIEQSIPETQAVEIINAAGLIVTPGLIDLHVHAYWGVCCYGIEPDSTNVAVGVTTALDCGSAGARTFPAFRKYVLQRSDTRLFALLNISAMGMISTEIGELVDPRWANVDEAVAVGRQNRDLILGIKVRIDKTITGNNDKIEMLKRALEAGDALDMFVMVHVGDSDTPLDQLTNLLRPGDVVTHSFRHQGGVVGVDRHLLDGVREARTRGVLFDLGHGAGSFSFNTAETALAAGFGPDTISSDVSLISIGGPVFDLLTTMSKFIHLGLSLEEVIRLSTVTPAQTMGMTGRIGTLQVGAEGDVAILSMDEGQFTLTDAEGVSLQARQKLRHVHTIKAGRVYRPWLK